MTGVFNPVRALKSAGPQTGAPRYRGTVRGTCFAARWKSVLHQVLRRPILLPPAPSARLQQPLSKASLAAHPNPLNIGESVDSLVRSALRMYVRQKTQKATGEFMQRSFCPSDFPLRVPLDQADDRGGAPSRVAQKVFSNRMAPTFPGVRPARLPPFALGSAVTSAAAFAESVHLFRERGCLLCRAKSRQ
jgi:hypothetical protein